MRQKRPIWVILGLSINHDFWDMIHRGLHMCPKRPISVKRDLYTAEETYINASKETSMSHLMIRYLPRFLQCLISCDISQKRPIQVKKDLHMCVQKELGLFFFNASFSATHLKRGYIYMCRKRLLYMLYTRPTCMRQKRPTYMRQNRPTYMCQKEHPYASTKSYN